MERRLVFFEETQKIPAGAMLVSPDMTPYIRDVHDVGPIGAVVKRFLKLSLVDKGKLGIRNLPYLLKIAAKDFTSGLMILVEMELMKTKNFSFDTVVLSDQISDLGVAYSNSLIFSRFLKLVHAYGKRAGIWTNNFGPAVTTLGGWRLKPDILIAPFNRDGYLMNPDKVTCERLLAVTQQEVWSMGPDGKTVKLLKSSEKSA